MDEAIVIERVFLRTDKTLVESVGIWLDANRAETTWLVVDADPTKRLPRFKTLSGTSSQVVAAVDAAERLLPSMNSVDPLIRRQALWKSLHAISETDRSRHFPSADRDENRLGWDSAIGAVDELFSELTIAGFWAEDVARIGADLLPLDERHRWRVLTEIEQSFLDFIEPYIPAPVAPPKRLVLAAVGDPPGRLRRWVNQNLEALEIFALVAAPESEAAKFDEMGAVVPRAWKETALPIDLESLVVATSASVQARAAFDALERLTSKNGGPSAIAILDDAISPFVNAEGRLRGHCKPKGPTTLARSAPFRLLDAVADYLEADGFGAFSAIVRHPDFEETLEREPLKGVGDCSVGEALADLDELAAQRSPDRISRFWNANWDKSERRAEVAVDAVVRRVDKLLDGLKGTPTPLTSWLPRIREFLERVYGAEASWKKAALNRLLQAMDGPVSWNRTLDQVDIHAWESIRWLVNRNASEKIETDDDESVVQKFDWPEATWSDAESIILVGFNEGKLPTSKRGGLFLPNALRERLREASGDGRRLTDNDQRYALDAYRLSAAMMGRKDVVFVAGRLGAANEPLLPSRFWFARPAEELADRVKEFYQPSKRDRPTSKGPTSKVRDLAFRLPPAPSELSEPITSLRVTAFRDYLSCPYRFYLRHVLKLRMWESPSEEMTGAQFGSLAHDVLEDLSRTDLIEEADPDRIAERLSLRLDERAFAVFGSDLAPAVKIQIEQLRGRLAAFAKTHAKEVANGWRIKEVEQKIDEPAGILDVDGEPFRVNGRIDRIDVNMKTGAWRLLDYKTGDSADTPDRVHRQKGEWVDLQLPLYWSLTETRLGGDYAGVGYVLLTKDHSSIGVELANWNREEMGAAVAVAKDVVRKIRRGEFWPPKHPAPYGFQEFAGLCRDAFRPVVEAGS